MPDLRELTLETFTARLGQEFEIHAGEEVVLGLRLAEAEALGQAPSSDARVPFSLIFRGASEDRVLPQAVYGIEHATLGRLELFLVPLQPDATGTRYQAIFS